ncbi:MULTISPECIES: hypothetical protein [unclassified Modestobacter]
MHDDRHGLCARGGTRAVLHLLLGVALVSVAVLTLTPAGTGWAWGSPLQELRWYASGLDSEATVVQLAGNLGLLVVPAALVVARRPATRRLDRLAGMSLGAGTAIELLQWALPLGRVVSPLDAVLNAVGAVAAGVVVRQLLDSGGTVLGHRPVLSGRTAPARGRHTSSVTTDGMPENARPRKHRIRRAVIAGATALTVAAGGGSAWALDRFVIDHVEISDVAAYEAAQSGGADASALSTGGTVTGSSYTSDGATVELSTVVTGSGDSTVTYYVAEVTLTDATVLQSASRRTSSGPTSSTRPRTSPRTTARSSPSTATTTASETPAS